MRFSDIAKGKAKEKAAVIPGIEVSQGVALPTLIRPLTAMEEVDVAAAAIAFAKSKGAPTTPDSKVYQEGEMAATIALAYLDPDSDPKARKPTFDLGAEQVLRDLDTDTVAMLSEQHGMWQQECSPGIKSMSPSEAFDLAKGLVKDQDDPKAVATYSLLSPIMRWNFTRFMAALLASSQDSRFFSSATSGKSPETESKSEHSPTSSPKESPKPPMETSSG
jgi:hypothetical protein